MTARAEAAALQAILVVHRRLVDEIGEGPVGLRAAGPEEDDLRAAEDRDRRQSGAATLTSSQSLGCRRAGAREHRVDDVERREIDDAGMGAGRRRAAPRTPRRPRAGDGDQELAAAGHDARLA